MEEQFDSTDFDVILESLKHYKMNIENYSGYPSYEFKQKQLERVNTAEGKVKALRRKLAQE
jgi:hypothetical protein